VSTRGGPLAKRELEVASVATRKKQIVFIRGMDDNEGMNM
jgi:hypothetical protein